MDEIEIVSRLSRIESRMESDITTLFNRMDKNDKLTETVHSLASDIRVLAEQVKAQGDRFEQIVLTYDNRFKELGNQIGALEKEPATKWKNLSWLIIVGVVTAIVGFFMAKLL